MPTDDFNRFASSVAVVVPSLNQVRFLGRTLASVLSQTGDFRLTVHVVDGGSTDGTVELLGKIGDPRLTWTSAPDAGQADAVNRGINRSTGEIVGWLNSDDLYRPAAVAAAVAAFADPAVQWVVGRCDIIDADDTPVRAAVARYKNQLLDRFSNRGLLRQNCVPQPAVFWRRSFGDRAGPLDPSLHFTMDYDLWLRMARLSPPKILSATLAAFRVHGSSKTARIDRRQFDEGYRVANRYFGTDRASRVAHRFHVEKIVWAYRAMGLLGW